MNPALLLALIASIITGVIGFGLAWQLQSGNITKINLDHKDERIALQRAARTQAERHIETVRVAQDKAQVRLAAVVDNSKHLASELDGLRNASEASLRTATGSIDACLADATTKTELLNHCSGRLVEVSTAADRHVIDIITLTESWPK